MPSHPESVDDIVKDFRGRRSAIIRALTTEVDEFYALCDPDKENQCLFGYPNDLWDVKLPSDEIPAELPEPALGINFPRDGMDHDDWVSLVAVHSDSWLLSVAFYYAAGLDANKRKQLFTRINEFETIFEVVKKTHAMDEKSSVDSGSRLRGKEKMKSHPEVMDECSVNQ